MCLGITTTKRDFLIRSEHSPRTFAMAWQASVRTNSDLCSKSFIALSKSYFGTPLQRPNSSKTFSNCLSQSQIYMAPRKEKFLRGTPEINITIEQNGFQVLMVKRQMLKWEVFWATCSRKMNLQEWEHYRCNVIHCNLKDSTFSTQLKKQRF